MLIMETCVSGKKVYFNQQLAEEALIGAHTQFEYREGAGPIAVYLCEDCGNYHLTSRGPMNTRLAELIKDGKINRLKEANQWEGKLKKR